MSSRRSIILSLAFLLSLLTILWYYNGHHSGTTVEKQPQQASVRRPSKAAAISPSRAPLSRLMVVARYAESSTWLDTYFGDVPHVVVQMGERMYASHAALENAGREAGAYLWWIAEYYDSLPDVIAFLHGHRRTVMHTTGCDIVPMMKAFRWESVDDCYFLGRAVLHMDGTERFGSLQSTWPETFDRWLGPLPKGIHYFANAQFVVHKSRILQYPKLFWQTAYNYSFTISGDTPDKRSESRAIMGYTWESMWSFILSKYRKDQGTIAVVEDGPFCPDGYSVVAKFHDCDLYKKMVDEFKSCDYMKEKGLANE